ncbi:hypothetical protein QW060_02675 [Myroides ceti]|uniref:SprT-like domain-containing protein n=1 Tax=Paenimyroides ceti TaxID=395087 RepID=A0ABT8CR12_9FLAO|nr:hypothetical protein [Paenimyroides ceti]MDN3706032.1 hypothetical protein [Paenimyroides ceti]
MTDIYKASKGGGNSSNSFGAWFLSLFENDKINVDIKESFTRKIRHTKGEISVSLKREVELFTSNKKFEKVDLFIAIAHELAHGLSYNYINKAQIDYNWLNTTVGNATVDEVFATIIENYIRGENKTPIRTHYFGPKIKSNEPSIFEQSRIYNEDPKTGQFELTVPALNIYNNYKKSFQNKGIQWID